MAEEQGQEGQQEGQQKAQESNVEERLEALQTALQAERESRIRLEAQLQSRQPPAPEEPKPKTREELQAMVDSGTLTESQMAEILVDQRMKQMESRLEQKAAEGQSKAQTEAKLNDEMALYREHIPAITKDGSKERQRLVKEYTYLRSLGMPESLSTEVAACRSCFGPPERIKETTRARGETHKEMAAPAGGHGSEQGAKGPDISARHKAYYAKQIDKGLYTGWDDPKLKRIIERTPSPS